MSEQRTLDVSALPIGTADSRALVWWGNLGMMTIEGTIFAMLVATFLYFKNANLDWPPPSVPNPDLLSSTFNVVLLLLTTIPAIVADRGAARDNVTMIRVGFGLCILAGIVFLGVRVIAVSTLGFRWSDHAYGSVVWTIIGMHTFHMIAATCETGLLFVYTLVRPMTKKQLLDVRTTAVYWYFVIVMWVPFYFIIYVLPYHSRK